MAVALEASPVFLGVAFQFDLFFGAQMANTLDQDVLALKEWLRVAWRYLADPCLTSFERREIRNYRREAESVNSDGQHFDFRILKVDA